MTTLAVAPAEASDSARAAGRRGGVARLVRIIVRGLATVLMVAAVLLFAGLAVGPHLLGYRTETMLSGSMSPAITPGDEAVDTPQPLAGLRVGQIITYHIPVSDHRVVSHRIIAVTRTGDGTVAVRTKGDANTTADQWTARLNGAQVWQVRAVIPHLGVLIGLLRGPNLLRLFPLLLVVFAADVLIGIWRRPTRTAPA